MLTVQEAGEAVFAMCDAAGFWRPTMFVFSGGGLHVYWCMTEAIPQARWQPLAQALQRICQLHHLKFDASVTIDAARILRPPESFNYKTGSPRPVTMQMLGPVYTEDQLQQALEPHGALRVVQTAHEPSATNAAFMSGLDDAGAGPVDLESLADAGCGVIKEALDTGGRTHAEPLWNLLMLAASFDTDPDEMAQWIGEQHPDYTPEDTAKKLEEKRRARAQNPNIGWPTCASFSGVSSICQTCPHFAAGKTPFHLRPKPGANPYTTSNNVNGAPLPHDYYRTADGMVWTKIKVKDDVIDVPVCKYPIINGFLSADGHALILETTIERGPAFVELPISTMGTWQTLNVPLGIAKISLPKLQRETFREFVVAWLHKLQEMQGASRLKSAPNGWTTGGKFVFDATAYGPGTAEPVFVDPKSRMSAYKPVGNKQPWIDAAKLVTQQKSPELNALLASSFAAPLIELTGQSGAIMSAFSPASGCGKSTSLKVAQGVWGHPKLGVNSLKDTDNAVFAKLAALRNLPLYWDELHLEADAAEFAKTVFRITQGRDKARLDRNATMRDTHEFASLVVACSNVSIADKLAQRTKDGPAGMLRCFEFKVPDLTVTMAAGVADEIIDKLRNNHGVIGIEYAKFLGENYALVKQMVLAARQHLSGRLQLSSSERFFECIGATLITGAQLANHLGFTNIDVAQLDKFICDTILHQRSDRQDQITDTRSFDGVESVVDLLIREGRNNFMIVSDHVSLQGGAALENNMLHGPHERVQGPWAQFGFKDRVLRVVRSEFRRWLIAKGYSPSFVIDEMGKRLSNGVTPVKTRAALGVGTASFDATAYATRPLTYDFNLYCLVASSGSPAQSTP